MLAPNNYYFVSRLARRSRWLPPQRRFTVHKSNEVNQGCRLSIVLLDWSCRERFHTLDWLAKQNVPRHQYELIWIELYDRVVPEVIEKVDVYITCEQKGIYHKHIGYNIGLLQAKGDLVCICDSDAVYPPNFVESIFSSFQVSDKGHTIPLVLMHYQKRTSFTYPENLRDVGELDDSKWIWWRLVPNAGACMTVRKEDAIRYGGFDEHKSYRGYICGPYELGWRLVNAGIPEVWHDTVVIWHFAHPDPVGGNKITQSISQILETRSLHVDCHALTAVEAFSTGRLLPLQENPEIFRLRLKDRHIGTHFEKKYSYLTGPSGFSRLAVFFLGVAIFLDTFWSVTGDRLLRLLFRWSGFKALKQCYERLLAAVMQQDPLVIRREGDYNIVRYEGLYYAFPLSLGEVNPEDPEQLQNPAIFSAQDIDVVSERIRSRGGGSRKYSRFLWFLFNKVLFFIPPELLKELIPRSQTAKVIGQQGDYNIVRYKGRYYGFPSALGEIDPSDSEQLRRPGILFAWDIEELRSKVPLSRYPKVISREGDYNIVWYRGRYYGFPLSLGEIDPEDPQQLQNPAIFSADDIGGVTGRICPSGSNTKERRSFPLFLVNTFFRVFPLGLFQRIVLPALLQKLKSLYRKL